MKIKFLVALLVIVVSIIPLQNVSADGVEPIEVEFFYHPNKKGGTVEIQLSVVSDWVEGKLVEIRFEGDKNPSVVNFRLDKAPGKNMYVLPGAGFTSVATKNYKLTEETQYLLITIYDFAFGEPITFAYHIPPISD